MRRRRSSRSANEASVDLTPMMDITFILLIFFIVTATFLQEEGLEIPLPPPASNDQPARPLPTILVQVDDQDSVFVNFLSTDVERVTANVQRQIVENGGRSVVVVQATAGASHGKVTAVYQAATRANPEAVVVRRPTAS